VSDEYWDTFSRIGREVIAARLPAGWELVDFHASQGRVSASFEWSGGHALTIEGRGPSEHEALVHIADLLSRRWP
jgi:hypothetical protein